MSLSAVLATACAAAGAAKTPADLAAALSAFEKGIAAAVAALNKAGMSVPITAPPAIIIAGINA